MESLTVTERTKIKRLPKRASYDKDTIFKILDNTFLCNIAFNINGQVAIIPTAFGRKDDLLYIHGSKKSRMLNSFKQDEEVAVSVTLVDGLVLARSAFHHSINYRSVILYAKPKEIIEPDEKIKALEIIIEHIIPGRWKEARKPNKKELNATLVFSFNIKEASAKIRTGFPIDEKEDLDLEIWAGIIPFKVKTDQPVRDTLLNVNISLPDSVKHYLQ